GVEIKLTRESDNEIISSFFLPFNFPPAVLSFRIDPWFPLIFKSGETFGIAEGHANYECKKEQSKCTLTMNPIRSCAFVSRSHPTEIYSDILKIGSSSIAVSREV
ncbi:hypothetical protein PFISCL1PPCAC_25593, partial [Pristionchus fissidentatus]